MTEIVKKQLQILRSKEYRNNKTFHQYILQQAYHR